MKTYLTKEDVAALEKAAGNFRDRLLIHLLFHLGCRISEALGISVQDIDLDHGTVTIQHLKTRLQLSCVDCNTKLSRMSTFCPGCGAKVAQTIATEKEHRRLRVLPLSRQTVIVLRDYIQKGGPVNRNGRLVLFGINRHRAWQVIKECGERARLPKLINPETGRTQGISPHRFRDAFAVRAVKLNDSGDGLRMLQEQLGHASFNTTAKYRKVAGDELKNWYAKLWEK